MNINDFKEDFGKAIEFFKTDIAGLRTGRATSAMVENVTVEAYGIRQPLKAVASISIMDPKTLMLDPWDKTILAAVEKGIRDANIGINPVNDGRGIRLSLPELTVERRQELIKILRERTEGVRIAIRKIREDIKDMILAEQEDNNIAEDEKFRLMDELEKAVKDYNEEIKEIANKKEEEISTV
ncbi:MAG: ribosome recycling factor [Candidatus Magasanikbacteria bacterium RIFOXYC2_FULL_42_28]|uniref:Ribosome-recycling factor n=1 Tax=Candidatus Magasanikbacteria bacterium RIFOXYC2_FULL_42_28 TaxID=1798704 RepID=A0A1F6NUS9_9BACT|nr:MAG: ribosome recycling factor [Candidatus Magasanikbacteria bacterium RIFOXYC2_FULL_42_28]